MNRKSLLILLALLEYFVRPSGAQAQGSVFTYSGRLSDSGSPANGNYDLQFVLFDALTGGNSIGNTNTLAAVPVTGGLFMGTLDFGSAAFPGAGRWLEIAVRTNGSPAPHTILTPRQPVHPTPYAITAANLSGLLGETNLPDGIVTSNKLAAGSVHNSNLAEGSVTQPKLAADAVTAPKLASDPASLQNVSGGLMSITNGRVGIGTAPNEKLSVAGLVESTSGGFRFPDGTVQSSAALLPMGPVPKASGNSIHLECLYG